MKRTAIFTAVIAALAAGSVAPVYAHGDNGENARTIAPVGGYSQTNGK